MRLKDAYKVARKHIQWEIMESTARCWKLLLDEVIEDPWGRALKIITKKLKLRGKTPRLSVPVKVSEIILELFPRREC